jgi:hypothetical protein
METQYISLNMTPTGVNPCFHISQYDVGRTLGFIVHSGGVTVDLDTYTCIIEATRSDGTAITSAVATTDNIGTFEVTPTMSNKADKYRCQLVIVDENSKRIASLPFDMDVCKAAMDENSEAIEEDKSLYQQYTEAVQGAIAEANADIQAEENARIAAVNAEATARANADTTLQNNINAEATARANAITAEATARQTADNTLQGNINSEASTRATQDASLQSQINQIIAPSGEAPSAAEVQNARIGADGVTYSTLGEAIRTNDNELKSTLSEKFEPFEDWYEFNDSTKNINQRFVFHSSSDVQLASNSSSDAYKIPLHGSKKIKLTGELSNSARFIWQNYDGSYGYDANVTAGFYRDTVFNFPPSAEYACLTMGHGYDNILYFAVLSTQELANLVSNAKYIVNKSTNNFGLGSNVMASTTGGNNSALGASALLANTTGANNVGIGVSAGRTIETGSGNVAIGLNADVNSENVTDGVAIGKNSKVGTNSVAIGVDAKVPNTYSLGIGQNSKTESNYALAVGTNAKASHRGSVAIGTDSDGNGASSKGNNTIVIGTNLHTTIFDGNVQDFKAVSSVPNATLGTELAPDLSTWTGTGASWQSSYWDVSEGGNISASIDCEADNDYLITLVVENAVTSNDMLKPMSIILGDASIPIFSANDANWAVVLSPSTSGANTIVLGGATWSGHIKGVSVKKVNSYRIPQIKVQGRNLYAGHTNIGFGNGQDKLVTNIGVDNVGIGYNSQLKINTGCGNTAVGYLTQSELTNGSHNNAFGENAQRQITTGMYNTGVGYASQEHLTTGCWNVAMGNEAQRDLTTGHNNVSLGRRVHNNIVDGNKNTAVGAQAGFYRDDVGDSIGTVHGNEQTFIGYQATQYSSGTKDKATAIGSHACANENGLAIGAYAEARANGSVAIGRDASGNSAVATSNNDFVLGTSAHRFIMGDKVISFNNDGIVTWTYL